MNLSNPDDELFKYKITGILYISVTTLHMFLNSVYSPALAQDMYILILLSLPLTTLCTDHCPPLPTLHCAQVWDSHDCSGGWNLTISDGESLAFDGIIFSTTWWFR